MTVAKGYVDSKYPTVDNLKDTQKNKSVLIIGTGASTAKLLPYKELIKNKFDKVIGLNFSIKDFEKYLDWHFIIEKKPIRIVEDMIQRGYRKDLPRVLNWKAINLFPQDFKIYKATRSNFKYKPDIFNYKNKDGEGFLMGPTDSMGLSAGSVMLQSLHFSAILGFKKIYLIGADLIFRDEFDHYYRDKSYRQSTTKIKNRSPIVEVDVGGKKYSTTEHFRESAKFIDKVIEKYCKPKIKVFDFSDGLINRVIKLNIDEFFK